MEHATELPFQHALGEVDDWRNENPLTSTRRLPLSIMKLTSCPDKFTENNQIGSVKLYNNDE